jgi:hypothetical protein
MQKCMAKVMLMNHEPSSMTMNADLSAVCQSQCAKHVLTCHTTYGSRKVCNFELDHCDIHRTWEALTSKDTVEIPATSTCLSVVYPD